MISKPVDVNLACSAAEIKSALDPQSGALRAPTRLQRLQVERKRLDVGGAHAPLVHAYPRHRILGSVALRGRPQEAHIVHFHRPQPPRILEPEADTKKVKEREKSIKLPPLSEI